jgi:Icc-related predicted phosphoesterase
MNPAYCSDLEQEIIESKPDYWACGHIHKHQEHQIGNTLVVSNPLGYPDEYGVGTDVNFSIII